MNFKENLDSSYLYSNYVLIIKPRGCRNCSDKHLSSCCLVSYAPAEWNEICSMQQKHVRFVHLPLSLTINFMLSALNESDSGSFGDLLTKTYISLPWINAKWTQKVLQPVYIESQLFKFFFVCFVFLPQLDFVWLQISSVYWEILQIIFSAESFFVCLEIKG